MDELFGERVFGVGDDEYRWQDVVLAAHAWGDWAALADDVRHILACVERLRESPEAPTDEELENEANEFRYQRDLLSSEEMEAWLDTRKLTADMWMEHIVGVVSTRKCADLRLEPDPPPPDTDIEPFLLIEATCNGSLDRWARKLAGRVAAAAKERERAGPATDADADAEDTTEPDASADPEALWALVGLDPDTARERLDRLARVDATFKGFARRVLTPTAIREQIAVRHLDWIRFRGSKVSFPSEAMAREAALCMKDDHLELAEVAADAGQAVEEVDTFLEEIDADFRDRFLGARRKDLIGPLSVDPRFDLYVVLDKILPSVDDAAIRERAEQEVLRRAVNREIDERVRWDRPI